jgi:hypothetical protein
MYMVVGSIIASFRIVTENCDAPRFLLCLVQNDTTKRGILLLVTFGNCRK